MEWTRRKLTRLVNLPLAHIISYDIYSSKLSLSFLAYTNAKNIRIEGPLEDYIHIVVVIVDIDLRLIR